MTVPELKSIAQKAGALVVRVVPLKKRTGEVELQLSFYCPAGKKELVLASDVTPEAAQTAIVSALA